jgi:hypothetical protein
MLKIDRRKSTPKFTKGEGFMSVGELCGWLLDGKWVFLYGRPTHPSWLLNMSLWTLKRFANSQNLCKAELNLNWLAENARLIKLYE